MRSAPLPGSWPSHRWRSCSPRSDFGGRRHCSAATMPRGSPARPPPDPRPEPRTPLDAMSRASESFSERERDRRDMDSQPSDEALLQAVADHDLGAFQQLYERHAGWLSIRLARRCNDGDLVADAVQDTFVAVWRKPQGFRGEGDIAAWLWGIAIRRLVSRLRTHRSLAAIVDARSVPAAEDQVLLSVEYGDVGQAL